MERRAVQIRAATAADGDSVAVIALPNPAGVALHERFGLRPAGRFPEVGSKFGAWIDVGYWLATL